jgi:carboxypeptidase family protein
MRIIAITTLLTSLSGIGVTQLNAQGTTATILGTVTDMTGAGVPETAVQVKNVGTGITQSTVSDAVGRFTVPDLGIGEYEVQASKAGFSTVVHKGITLTVGSQAVIDFSLPVGQQTQTVTVESQASQVETTNAAVGALISQAQMENLPLNGRNFEQLIFLSPGVQIVNSMNSNARQGRQSVFSAAGARPEGQELLLDDESIVNYWKRGVGTITGSSLGMEAMAEFQALTNTYGAQFGGNGAVINAVSKSGTNGFHGSAYEFIRNSVLDGRGFFDPAVIPFRRNQPGGSLGGPVKKDKAFFFVNYEGVWQLLAQTKVATVPDAAHRTPTFPRANNPVSWDGTAAALALYPMPAYNFNPAAGTGQVTQVANQVAHENYFLGRFDYTFSAKDSFFTRYFFDKQHVTDPFGGGYAGVGVTQVGLPLWPEKDDSFNHFATIEWRRIISPTLLNTARVSFSRPNTAELDVNHYPALQVFPGLGRADAAVQITGISPLGQAILSPPPNSRTAIQRRTTSCGPTGRTPRDSAPLSSGSSPTATPRCGRTQIGFMEAWQCFWRAGTRRPPSGERREDPNTTSTGISVRSISFPISRKTGR